MNRMRPLGAKTWLILALTPSSAFAQVASVSSGEATSASSRASANAESAPEAVSPSQDTRAIEPPTATGSPANPYGEAQPTTNNVSPGATIRWQSPPDCPPPDRRLDELLSVPSKHPLWGSVEVSQRALGYRALLRLSDGPTDAPNVSVTERVLEGNTCVEVTEAALLIVSIMQREQREMDAGLSPESTPPLPNPNGQVVRPALPPPALPAAPPKSRAPAPSDSSSEKSPLPTATTIALGAAWSLWNGQSPAAGVIAEFEHAWGRLAIRPQLGFATAVNPIPTSEAVKVDFTTYDAGLRLCFNMVAGVHLCGGPTVQRITVVGSNIGEPAETSAWFPGASLALHGSQNGAGIGLWGALGANFRFKEIALDVNPVGEVATVKRLTVYAWLGPQWRWP